MSHNEIAPDMVVVTIASKVMIQKANRSQLS
jgi:hypothetical protein